MSVHSSIGGREFAGLVKRCTHISVMEHWYGWYVTGRFGTGKYVGFEVGPFTHKREAVAWLSSWCDEPRPLKVSGLGAWHWFAEPGSGEEQPQ